MQPDFALFGPVPPGGVRDWVGRDGRPRAVHAALIAVGATWLPIVVMAALEGDLVSLLSDPGPHARLLLALPLLVLVPVLLDPRLAEVYRQFVGAGLVRPADREAYAALGVRSLRLRDSRLVRLVCLGLAIALAAGVVGDAAPVEVGLENAPWRVDEAGGRSPALWWYALVGRPIYFLVQALFLWRLALWWRFLWRVSRLPLALVPGHPDGAGGLGFLVTALRAFYVPAFALAAAPAGGLAALILQRQTHFADHTYALGALLAMLVALFGAPFLFFALQLHRARRRGELAYAALAQRQLRRFEDRWVDAETERDDLLEAPDFSAVIDLDSVVATALRVRLIPVPRRALVLLAVAAALPFAPVAALELPLREAALEAVKLLL